MRFSYSDEQEEFRRVVRRFLEDHSQTAEVRRWMDTSEGYDPRWILPITMSELYAAMGDDYVYRRAFPLMTDPPKTFLLFERADRAR